MKFLSEEEAYLFYNKYAKTIGFSIRRSSGHKVMNSSTFQQRTFTCSRQGHRREDKREETFTYSRPETRCGCDARMKISLRDGFYYVYEFEASHNHTLANGLMAQYLRSQRKVTEAQIANAEVAKSVGISNKATIDLMAKEAGGSENLGFTPQDMKNCLYSKRTIKAKVGDTGGVLEYMEKKVSEDVNFFYSIQVDEDELITNIFWADSKMVSDYAMFGDVICFDTTYRKLDDGRPFGLIVGVNNHKKTIAFGAALLYDETAASFAWLFRTFLKVMSGKHPRTILTDEDAAMAKAICEVFPHSHHRLCVWHMNQNACKHLAGVVDEYKKFNVDFQHCIYDIEEEDEFVGAWDKMIDKYGLRDNEWLQRLFEKKEHWALVYGKNTFSAHMSTTQRSESMNNELKRYISIKYDMLTFFKHFERLVSDKRCEEVKYDFKATQTTPKLKAESSYMLKQAAATYTPAIFKMVQDQVLRTLNYDTMLCDESDTKVKIYVVKFHGTQREHVVRFIPKEEKVSCSCKRFEFAGILCSHCLKVLDINNIKHIPGEYILKRWTIDAKVLDITSKCNPRDNLKARMSNRYKELCRIFVKIAARAAESEESYYKAAKCAEQLAQDVEKCLKIRADPDLVSVDPHLVHVDPDLVRADPDLVSANPDLGNSSTKEGTNYTNNNYLHYC
ncbi:protein FAR1-RELATED SEQUENCE 5-like [Aegilops tauschii subsp. strangulata]|uniref:protein FAR1-RELATED SEQUENCE 5-like n=1 Tax=Aegilops tauschii subsp. strangulata TaxID=200361 RepID=UPI003CC8A6DF